MKSLRKNDASLEEQRRSSASAEIADRAELETPALETTQNDFDDAYDEDDEEELDPLYEEMLAYLDDELEPDAKKAFEEKLANDPELQKRLEEERATWDALDLLDAETPKNDLTEPTVERLNSETQIELAALRAKKKRQKRLFICSVAGLTCLLWLLGYALFSLAFPDVEQLRKRDFRIVEKLPQLETAESFEYLTALYQAKLFQASESGAARNPFNSQDSPSYRLSSGSTPNANGESYEKLAKDRIFYRLQRRFESLDKSAQKQLKNLYAQIEASPDSEKLWSVADAYELWLETAMNDSERERLYESSIPERINTIREKQAIFMRLQDYFRSTAGWREENRNEFSRQPQGPNNPNPNDNKSERAQNEDASEKSPTVVAFRFSLPKELQHENLADIYKKYTEYRNQRSGGPLSRLEGIFEFLADTQCDDLINLLSPDAQKYLRSKSEVEVGSILGMIVSLSCLENDENEAQKRNSETASNPTPPQPPKNDENPNPPANGPRNPNRPNRFGGGPMGPQQFGLFEAQNGMRPGFGFGPGTGGFDRRQNSVPELAKSLRNAPDGIKNYVGSNPPQIALPALIGFHWNASRQFQGGQFPGSFPSPRPAQNAQRSNEPRQQFQGSQFPGSSPSPRPAQNAQRSNEPRQQFQGSQF